MHNGPALILLENRNVSRRNMKFRFSLAVASLLVLSALVAPLAVADQNELHKGPDLSVHPDGRGNRARQVPERGNSGAGAVVTGNGISYHNGPVMKGTVNVYYVYYGSWTDGQKALLEAFAASIGGSPYMAINTTYGDTVGNVSGQISFGGSTTDPGTKTTLADSDIASIVSSALSSGRLQNDPNGVFFVLTAAGIGESSGFLTQYCGWHTYGTFGGNNTKYAFVGNAAGPSFGSCAVQTSSPNNDPGVDAMISVMAHELEESASDPNLNAWYDSQGYENADKCAWTFGTTYQAANGSLANMNLGGKDYLIQRNWVNASGGYCALSYSVTPDFSLSVSPTSRSVTAGGTTAAYTVTPTALNNWAGTVTYSVTGGLPTGATANVSLNSITISTNTTVAPGSYNFTISGTDGTLTHTTTATLVVTVPSFTISISPASQTVQRPNSVTYTVTVTPQSGFSDNVALSAGPVRTGLNYGFDTNPVPSGNGSSHFTVTTSPSAKKGNVTLTVTGTGVTSGVTKSASATLRIQ